VFHLAATSRREHRKCDVEPFIEANVLFGTQLLEAMRLTACRHFVTAGSYLQHFDTDGYRALNLYAATKQAFEAILTYYVDTFRFSAVRITLCDVYSENDTRPKLMTAIAAACKSGAPLTLQDSKALVDLVHVEDAAAAFLQAASLLDSDAIPNQELSRYSVSSGTTVSAAELIGMFEKLGNRNITIECPKESGVWRRMTPSRGKPLPGWKPKVTLETGIARVLRAIGVR
jgi:nucleoside-diphosphate-sugar epimerase